MKKKILIIGFGSIGRKHFDVLNKFYKNKFEIIIFSKICKKKFTKKTLDLVKHINPDFFILCTPTNLHYPHLKLICENFNKKIILCEKPLFLKIRKLNYRSNKIFVGYNLRFHPLIAKLKKLFEKKYVDKVNIFCTSNVLNWRKTRKNYSPYSLSQNKSGGVLFDLSHEIDYFIWIFGLLSFQKIIYERNTINSKIKSKNFFYGIGKSNKCKKIKIHLDFASKKEKRSIEIYYKNKRYFGDIKNNYLSEFKDKRLVKNINFKNFSINDTYISQIHDVFISKKSKISCNYNDAILLTNKLREFSLSKLNKDLS